MSPEQKAKRISDLEWSCMTPDEHAARIVALEEIVIDAWHLLYDWLFKLQEVPFEELDELHSRMRELDVPMEDA